MRAIKRLTAAAQHVRKAIHGKNTLQSELYLFYNKRYGQKNVPMSLKRKEENEC